MSQSIVSSRWAVLLLVAAILLAGCAGGNGGDDDPGTTSPTPTTTPPASGSEIVRNTNHTFSLNAGIAAATQAVSKNFTNLKFSAQLWKTGQCGVLQAEPGMVPTSTTPARVTFTSPSGKVVGPMALGMYNSCDTMTNNRVGTAPMPVNQPGEMGNWQITFNGRGQAIQVQVRIDGT